MAVNSSSLSLGDLFHCTDSTIGGLMSFSFVITHISFVVPLSLLVLYLGHQRWWRKRSFETTSHSDIFTYHSAAMELINAVGFTLYGCGRYFGFIELMTVGFYATSNLFPGQVYLHILFCVERYLAVVHPVIYLRLRQSGGVKIRNISIGFVWLQYCGWFGLTALYFPDFAYVHFLCFLILSLAVVSFCSFSVVYVLIRPGPGEMGKNREQVDQTKRRAFYNIMVITGVLWLFFLGLMVSSALERSHLLSYNDGCLVLTCGYLVTLPNSLVLPLLFLHRAGKLVCCNSCNK